MPVFGSGDYSQCGEQLILEQLINKIKLTKNKFAIEFGASDSSIFSNTKFLEEKYNCQRLLFDIEPKADNVYKVKITSKNINYIFSVYQVPRDFDLLSIDIDGMDYWVLNALDTITYRPNIIIIEYNPQLEGCITVEENDNYIFDGTIYHGASYLAMCRLAISKNYIPIYNTPLNLIMIRKGIWLNTDIDCMDYVKIASNKNNFAGSWKPDNLNRKFINVGLE